MFWVSCGFNIKIIKTNSFGYSDGSHPVPKEDLPNPRNHCKFYGDKINPKMYFDYPWKE